MIRISRNLGLPNEEQIGSVTPIEGGGLRVYIFPPHEITEIELRAIFGTADVEILETFEGSGCYDKIRKCLIWHWSVPA